MALETKLGEISGKLKALSLTIGKSNEAITGRNKESLLRHVTSIAKKVEAMYALKEEIVELKFVANETEQDAEAWAENIDTKLNEADGKVTAIRELLATIDEEEKGVQRTEAEQVQRAKDDKEREKQLALEHAKFELQKAHKEEEWKRELQHQEEILNQKLKYQKLLEVEQETKLKKVSTKLPKRPITQFNGKFSEWLAFWNAFETEIDSSDLSPVAKFGYLKEWLEPSVRADVEGLPFTTEGYQRAKNILQSEYGKTSEIINTHVQNIMGLPIISDTQPTKVHEFYKTLMYNVQSLETLGKLEKVNGMTRSVIEKLKGIKADLVRGEEGWQEWELSRLVQALKKWKDINPVEDSESNKKPKRSERKSGFYHVKDDERRKRVCVYCEGVEHSSKDCPRVTTFDERKKLLAQKKLCFNCTGGKHRAAECKSNITCQNCNLKHHTSICNKQNLYLSAADNSEGVLVYPVVVVKVEGVKCRALLDTGAGNSYASAALLNRLPKRNSQKEIRHIEMMLGAVTKEMEMSTVKVEALDGKFNMDVNVTKVDKGDLLVLDNPNYEQLLNTYKHLEGVQMVENDRKPKLPVHMILGASDYMRIKTGERPRVGKVGEPVAEKTRFGWTIIAQGKEIDYTALLLTQASQSDYEELCRLDVLGLADTPEHDQQTVHAEFCEQLVRDPDGWYETGLLWKQSHPKLPSNKTGSLRRLDRLFNKLEKMEVTREYNQVIEQQKEDGIVEAASEPPTSKEFYLPHKPVVRTDAESTKLRVVYDGSARENPQAPSLNECLYAGPSLQNKLWNVLTRMRFHPVALSGDLKQAFLQVRIKKEERDSLRFHWKPTEHSQPETLRFTRALFGLTCSPFLLAAVIDHHLKSWETREPELVADLRQSLYVDDLLSGKPTVASAIELKEGAIKIFEDAKFTLHKWHSNSPELEDNKVKPEGQQNEVKPEGDQVEAEPEQTFAKQQLSKFSQSQSSLLGLMWNKQEDEVSVVIPKMGRSVTKRELLRNLARIYDPLGLVSPVTLKGKHIYREACKQKVPWDVNIPEPLSSEYLQWVKELPEQVTVPRSLAIHQEVIDEIELHAFGDASMKGVAAAVYAITKQASGENVGLVAAKARLAKQDLTIPRLELVSAHMAANLVSNVQQAIDDVPVISVFGWLDSTVALQWLRGGGEYKQFVANRVKKIHEHPEITWRHVPTHDNPADLGSRAGKVLGNCVWWNGPEWLVKPDQWPPDIVTKATSESESEVKAVKAIFSVAVDSTDEFDDLLSKFPLTKAIRIIAWVHRFMFNCRAVKGNCRKGPLITEEINNTHTFWVIRAQSCKSDRAADDKQRLNVDKSEDGVMYCNGRLQGEYPIYLPDDHPYTKKLVEDAHERTLHGGVGLTMTRIRERYWVPRLRQLVKKVIKKCFRCRRFRAKPVVRPPVGNLPRDRTEGSRPFQVVGVDFAGPIKYRVSKITQGKAYVTLFACSLCRAVYLELTKTMETSEFLQTLKRLIARKGRPEKIYSDNAGTFAAAAKWLKKVQFDERFQNHLANERIHWQFNCSRAPWWGGQFERLVGLVKRALYKSIGKSCLSWNELQDVLLDIEVTLNNRPLGYQEDDIELSTLTLNSLQSVQPSCQSWNPIMKKTETLENEQDTSRNAKTICGRDGVQSTYARYERSTT